MLLGFKKEEDRTGGCIYEEVFEVYPEVEQSPEPGTNRYI